MLPSFESVKYGYLFVYGLKELCVFCLYRGQKEINIHISF